MSLTLAEQLLYTTMRLIAYSEGKPVSTGTGFFYNVALEGTKSVPLIVTNKHVVAGCDRIDVICHQQENGEPSGQFINLQINLIPKFLIMHPVDETDLCAIPIGNHVGQATDAGTPIFFMALDKSTIPSDADWRNFDAIEDVTMIGCPNGIYDEVNKMPLTRRGITATSLANRYDGKPCFLIDMACYPGSSGSPVFLYNPSGFLDKSKNIYQIGGGRCLLVGVLFSGPTITNDGIVMLTVPPKVSVTSMMHLGICIRSSELLEIDRIALERAGVEEKSGRASTVA